MARIPIVDIPNAPQAAPAPLGEAHRVDLSTAASLLHRDTIAPGSFDGPAKGLQAIGAGLSDVSRAADTWGHLLQKKREADDDVHVMDGNEAMAQAAQDYQSALLPGSATDTWEPGLRESLQKSADKVLADPALSPRAKELFRANSQRFIERQATTMRVQATKASFVRTVDRHRKSLEGSVEAGDLPGALGIIDTMEQKQLVAQEDAQALRENASQRVDLGNVRRGIASDPLAMRERLKDPKNYPNFSPAKLEDLRQLNEEAVEREKRKKLDLIYSGIAIGTITDKDHAELLGGGYLGEADKARIQKQLGERFGPSFALRFKLEERLSHFDATGKNTPDVDNNLHGDIKTYVPAGWQEDLMRRYEANGKREHSSVDPWDVLTQELGNRVRLMQLGGWDPKGLAAGNREDVKKEEAAYRLASQIRGEYLNELRQTGQKATTEGARQWLNVRLRNRVLGQGDLPQAGGPADPAAAAKDHALWSQEADNVDLSKAPSEVQMPDSPKPTVVTNGKAPAAKAPPARGREKALRQGEAAGSAAAPPAESKGNPRHEQIREAVKRREQESARQSRAGTEPDSLTAAAGPDWDGVMMYPFPRRAQG